MFGLFKKKNRYIIFFVIFISFILHTVYFDISWIKEIIKKPNQALEEIKAIIFSLFISIFGKIILVCIFICIYYNFQKHFEIIRLKNRLNLWSKLSYYVNDIGEEVFNELPIGIVVIDFISQEVQWLNNYAKKIFKISNIINISLKEFNNQMFDILKSDKKKIILNLDSESFDCIYKKEFNVFYLFNVTEREKIKNLYNQKTSVLVFLSFDNFENSLKNCDLSEQSQIKVEYFSVLYNFNEIYEGYLKQFTDDKFLLLLNKQQLEKMIEDRFSILKDIRNISNKYKLKITLSMGVACYNSNYNQLASHAQNAIELAQKRGGDQVVVDIENQKIKYFGATQISLSEDSKVYVRVNAEIIKDFLEKKNSCFIMGHIYPDLDSFGSMIAFYKIALAINDNYKHYLVLDKEKMEKNFEFIYQEILKEDNKISRQIITTKQAEKIINDNSLLIILDTQNKNIIHSPSLLNLTSNIIIIDHHRSTEEVIQNTLLSYINSSSSSTTEMLIELIYFLNKKIDITPLEATIMYGGMIIDTNYFIYRTSPRTLEAASQLISQGADGTKVKFWLRKEFEKILEINDLISKVEIYMKNYAIVKSDRIYKSRSFLSSVSETLLNIKNIDAAFTICKLQENLIGISARSYNDFNVQIIMEQMGGGGHINSAATQIENNNIEEVTMKLKNIILAEYKGNLKNMKIILLENIKNKGNKNDVIEVNPGYGNFLIKDKKAILANKENLKKLQEQKEKQAEEHIKHISLLKQMKKDIDNKEIDIKVKIGPKGKIYGRITLNQIAEMFYNQYNILINSKKISLDSGEINSIGKYKVNVVLDKEIISFFYINVIENNNEDKV
ncbi:MAG: 50S ribosomal protein L9 [Candidatus Phytoplasma cynodontis]|uniref:50S ribosomal protein L9 n=1 Tax='Cynodon dactylon' phytoplasma TaxID=295320 RepID=UPI001265BAF3|nr:50S ribosomal protein L9 ['Cynodon dactylon' phytoplasma]KAB8122082.1 50S ribosomal protein L9 ['Cynodon dactylon' phytoplasma]WIA07501.1 MAG: 50S ribosomal protein L9 [Candidatus Phytoplasma cynodontis]